MDAKVIAIGGGIIGLVVLIVLWQARRDVISLGTGAVSAAKAVGTAINPLNPDNAVASTVNAVGASITGRDWSLGSWIYEVTH